MKQLEEIDKLFLYFRARITVTNLLTFTVTSHDHLPEELLKFCKSYNRYYNQHNYKTNTYEFYVEMKEDIKAALFIASESIRFKIFEASFNREVEETLDSQNLST